MTKPIRVLVVEDSEDDARLAMLMLRRSGFTPTYRRVQDVETLRRAFAEESWDAVLSDFRLPSFSGVDALNVFRETGLDIPFIFVSGTIGEETAVAAMKAGASDYVMKQNLARLAPVMERELEQASIRAQHRQSQVDLKASCERYQDLYDYAPVGYLTLSAQGIIQQINLTGAEMLSMSREQLHGSPFHRFLAADEMARWQEHCVQTLAIDGNFGLELQLRRGAGELFHAQLDCRRVLAPNADPMPRAGR